MFDFGSDGTQSMAAVANVIATKPGTASTGTVILAAHYDTVAGSPGAGDDGIGVGVLLETARALSTAGPAQNTVMILLTDGEEVGLLGAEAFVRERAKELGTAVVLNHEARGAGGAPLTFRMSSPNGELLEVLAGAPGVFADSGSEASFESLPNETDFRPFEQAGLYGYDTAIMADGAHYHSPTDDPAQLSAASLQQMGDTTLTMTRELASADLSAIPGGGEEIVTALPWGLLRYPQSLEIPLAIGVLVLAAVLVWALRRGGALTLPRAALSVAAAVLVLVAASAASYAVWRVALLIDPAQASAVVGEPYRPVLYRLAMLVAGLWVVALVVRPAPSTAGRRRPRGRHARRAGPRGRIAGVHRARPVRVGGAADAARDDRRGHRGAAPEASYGRPGRGLPAGSGGCRDPARASGLDRVRPWARCGTAQCGAVRGVRHAGAAARSRPPGHDRPARFRGGECDWRRRRRCLGCWPRR